jgi:hypothetical protein
MATTSGTEILDSVNGSALPSAPRSGLRAIIGPRRRSSGDHGGGGGPQPTGRSSGGRRAGLDLRNTWQILAVILTPLGVILILMSWYGAAHAGYVQEQIPYLVSGSFIGLGCMVLGGLLYWAHWLYRIYDQADQHQEEQLRQADRHHEEQLRMLEQIVWSLGGPRETSGSQHPEGLGDSEKVSSTLLLASSEFVATETGTAYHLPTCPVVTHHSDQLHTIQREEISAMEPCRICLPPQL